MSSSWQALLSDNGMADGSPTPVAHDVSAPVLVDLQQYAVLDITGSDAESFLQGQFCNDLAEATAEHAQLSGYCNPKGRLLALFTIFAVDGGYRLIMQAELLEAMCKRLQMFVMRADVTIAARDDLMCSGVIVPSADSPNVDDVSIPVLPAAMAVKTDDGGSWVRYGEVQYLFIAALEKQQPLWNSRVEKAATDAWRLQDILAGRPSLYTATVEQFVPQMINLQQAGGLSFTKGCYPGQEIVARMQYLGKLKRQMLRFTLDGSDVPNPGDAISTDDDSAAGVVVDAVVTSDGVQLLAVMKLSTVDAVLKIGALPLLKQDLPYDEQQG